MAVFDESKVINALHQEKAEEYADECFKANDKDSKYYRLLLITGYLDGLEEGRKEVSYMKAEEYDKYLEVCRENAELKARLEQAEKDLFDYQFNYPTIRELEKEIADLKNSNIELSCQKVSLESRCGEARKIIKDLLQVLPNENVEGVYEVTVSAEEFPREIEK